MAINITANPYKAIPIANFLSPSPISCTASLPAVIDSWNFPIICIVNAIRAKPGMAKISNGVAIIIKPANLRIDQPKPTKFLPRSDIN